MVEADRYASFVCLANHEMVYVESPRPAGKVSRGNTSLLTGNGVSQLGTQGGEIVWFLKE